MKFIVLGIALLLTTIMTWPFLPNIASYYPDQGDYALAGSVLWWNQDSIKTGRIFNQHEYFRGFQFYPQPFGLAFANNSFSPSLIFAPIYWLTGSLALSVNSYTFLTLVFSFISSYFVINYFTSAYSKNKWASLVGAFIFTFNPQTMVRFPQHLDILGKYWLPLVFFFAYRFLEQPNWKNSLFFFLSFTLNALTVNYYQIFSLVMLPLVALPFLWGNLRRGDWVYFSKLVKFGLIGLVFLPILLYFNLPYLDFSQKEGAYRSLESVPFFSARVNDWFSASPDNLVYGNWVKSMEAIREPKDDRNILNYEEHTLFVGFLALGLFVLGLKSFQRAKLNQGYFYILLVVPFILTFGPYFNGASQGLALPFYWLYQWVPLMEGIRSPGRFEFLFYIPFSLICAFGALFLINRWKEASIWVVIIFLFGLSFENLTVKSYDAHSDSLSKIQSIGLENLAFLKGKATLHLPIYTTSDADIFGKNSSYVNWATQTEEKIFNGNTSYLPPDQLGLLDSFQNLNSQSMVLLKALGINYLIFHKAIPKNDSVILDREGIMIVDLSKVAGSLPICEKVDLGFQETGEGELLIRNKANCFLISALDKRYQENDKFKFRMPLVVEPMGEVVVSVAERTLRIE